MRERLYLISAILFFIANELHAEERIYPKENTAYVYACSFGSLKYWKKIKTFALKNNRWTEWQIIEEPSGNSLQTVIRKELWQNSIWGSYLEGRSYDGVKYISKDKNKKLKDEIKLQAGTEFDASFYKTELTGLGSNARQIMHKQTISMIANEKIDNKFLGKIDALKMTSNLIVPLKKDEQTVYYFSPKKNIIIKSETRVMGDAFAKICELYNIIQSND